jgi:hypothetical protein
MIDEQYDRAKNLLRDKRKELDALAKALLEKEVLHRTDLENLIGKRPFADPTPGRKRQLSPKWSRRPGMTKTENGKDGIIRLLRPVSTRYTLLFRPDFVLIYLTPPSFQHDPDFGNFSYVFSAVRAFVEYFPQIFAEKIRRSPQNHRRSPQIILR